MRRMLTALLGCSALTLPIAATAQAAEPPNQKDPCSRAGRNICGTSGVGRYRTYEYGIRWFGDYRGAVPGVDDPTFCIDLRFWYPGRKFDYEKRDYSALRNRDGERVSRARLARMAYALHTYGRSNDRSQQGAVMLYVHSLMGDGARGEVAPRAVGLGSEYERIAQAAERHAGPYTLKTSLPEGALTAGRATTLKVSVVNGAGRAVPGVSVDLSATGADLPAKVDTGADGVASVRVVPDDVKRGLDITAKTADLAATKPALYVPTRTSPARSGQRLAGPATTTESATVARDVKPAQIAVKTKVDASPLLLGSETRDNVTISGAPHRWRADVEVRLFGPARSQKEISCTGTPAATTTYTTGSGNSKTPPLKPDRPGWYGYQLVVPSTETVTGTTTPCPLPEESLKVEVQPAVHTQVSQSVADPGVSLTDTVVVSGLAGEHANVNAQLFGPYPAADKLTCQGAAFWSGMFTAFGDGTYPTEPVKLTTPGYYTYRETLPATEFVRATETKCGEALETTIVRGAPQVTTQISAQETAPGAQITDKVLVSGLGALSATVNVELWGPFPSRDAIRCEGTPATTQQLPVNGDGSYDTAPFAIAAAGYYTYRESIAATPAHSGTQTACGEAAETTIARARPAVETVVSAPVVGPGAELSDTIKVTGLGKTPATIEVELFGPFESRADISCDGRPFWKGNVDVPGDGEFRSDDVTLNRAGFYTYREKIAGSETVAAVTTPCGEESETALGRPLILTGGRARVAQVSAREPAGPRPTRVSIPSRGVTASVFSATIDMQSGALAVPNNIRRVGWWRDGAAPGDRNGTVLLAGHVDSAKRGAGAFYNLQRARRGDRVTVTTSDGRTRTYRVTSRKRTRKEALPTSIFTRSGPRRLVLVTCGGPFDQQTGHYRDNVIVTATPA